MPEQFSLYLLLYLQVYINGPCRLFEDKLFYSFEILETLGGCGNSRGLNKVMILDASVLVLETRFNFILPL